MAEVSMAWWQARGCIGLWILRAQKRPLFEPQDEQDRGIPSLKSGAHHFFVSNHLPMGSSNHGEVCVGSLADRAELSGCRRGMNSTS